MAGVERKHFSRAPWEKEISLYKYFEEEVTDVKPNELKAMTT